MALQLSPPKDEKLPKSPLRIVVLNLRYTPTPRAASLEAGVELQRRLGGREAWRMEPLKTQTFQLAGGMGFQSMPTMEVQNAGWRLSSEDESSVATLSPESAGIETTKYGSWTEFWGRMEILLECLIGLVKPEAELRLGLRYVNRIDDPRVSAPEEWEKWIEPAVLGVVRHPIGRSAIASQQQLNLNVGDGIKATVGHGFFRDGDRLIYLIDFDTYREGTRPFDLAEVRNSAGHLHTVCLQLFQNMITAEMYDYLRGGRA